MPRRALYQDLYETGARDHAGDVRQWGTLANAAQYRLPYRKTLARLAPPARVLDWGCGNGHFSWFLTRRGFETVGYSFGDPPAFLADEPLFTHVRAREPVRLPFESARFDAAFSIGVIEHVHDAGGDPAASLGELERVLVPGGLLFVFHLPNRYTWVEFVVRGYNRLSRQPLHVHSRLYTERTFRRLLAGRRLEVVERGRYAFLPRNQMNDVPRLIGNSRALVACMDAVDDAGAALLPVLCTNWYFILRKTP